MDSPLFIVGESYAGHYVPAIAHRIWRGNKHLDDDTIQLNLKGLAVGNGWTDPELQLAQNRAFMLENDIIDQEKFDALEEAEERCTDQVHSCNSGGPDGDFACQAALTTCGALDSPVDSAGLNIYDIRVPCGPNPLCYDFSHIETFMNSEDTKRKLNVLEHDAEWQICNSEVFSKFDVDSMKTFSPYIADLLNFGFPVLIYAGNKDYVCNYLGNQAWTLQLEWKHDDDFRAAEEKDWNGGGGSVRSSNGFTFLQVYDAGHMVPTDQPEQALAMITQFIRGESF